MCRTIVVTSGKGGVGKTTILSNLGFALAKMNLKVLLLDVDFGLNNLDVVMGVENKIVYDFTDVLMGKCRAKQALIQDFFEPNLYIMPSCHADAHHKIDATKIKFVLDQLESGFDYILIDCPAGIDAGFHRAVMCAGEAIVVTTPHISAIRDADKVLSILHSYNLSGIHLLVNRARGDLMVSGEMVSDKTICEFLKTNLLGVVPEDDYVATTLLSGGAISNKQSQAYVSFNMIANNLHNGVENVYDCTKRYKGLLGSMRKRVKKLV